MNPFNRLLVAILLLFNVGLFIVDHIHFQYNGILFGIMLLSIVRIIQGRELEGAFWFAFLLNMKHIFLYISPAYFLYLLRTHCFNAERPLSVSSFKTYNFVRLATVVVVVFGISFGPFVYFRQIGQVLLRLFPFKRGLVHAYWAPNFWALYSGVDKALAFLGLKLGLLGAEAVQTASMTGGKVQEYNHAVLPSIAPWVTLVLTLGAMLPSFVYLWQQKTPVAFLRAVILCGFSSFMFGWHVHEKAILIVIIPMTMLILYSREDAKIFLLLSTAGFYSLFPLLFTHFENCIKVLLWLISLLFSFVCLSDIWGGSPSNSNPKPKFFAGLQLPLLSTFESLYVWGFGVLGLFNSLGYWLLGLETRLPFLPLMLTSLYCGVCVFYCWVKFYILASKESSLHGTKSSGFDTRKYNKTDASQQRETTINKEKMYSSPSTGGRPKKRDAQIRKRRE